MSKDNDEQQIVLGTCRDLDVNDSFFDVFRHNYGGFNNWFTNKCQSEDRMAFYIKNNNKIMGLCVLKCENINTTNTILKICSFKVSDNKSSLGTKLLNTVENYAKVNSFNYIYATTTHIELPISRFLQKNGFNYIMQDFKNNNYLSKQI